MCQKNVGRMDAFLRIAAGTVAVSVGIMKDRPSLATLGACKIASGVTRYCPIYDLLNVHTISDEEIFEELGLDYEEDFELADADKDDDGCGCGCGHDHDHEHPSQGRRYYTHRAVKRNQYVSQY